MQTSAVDLTNCDREPIHIPGKIQAHGVVLVLDEPELTVLQASSNAGERLGAKQGVLGLSLRALMTEEAIQKVTSMLCSPTLDRRPHYVSHLQFLSSSDWWSAALHRRDGLILLELQESPQTGVTSLQMQYAIRKAIADLDTCESLPSFCRAATEHYRELTHFDRVMIYRFLEDGSGVVLAESAAPGLEPYLGLRYPASDIPAQARELYRINPFRLTADVDAPPVPLQPVLNPKTDQALDLSLCALRATSPIHLEYLRNMGVAASLSFSILHRETLWGLVACHHQSPKVLSQEIRVAGEVLVGFLGLQVGLKEEAEHKQYDELLRRVRAQLRAQLSESGDYVEALAKGEPNLLSGIMASGAALCTGSFTLLLGQTPTYEQVGELSQWISKQPWQPTWSTQSLSAEFPKAESIKETASGALVSRVTQSSPEMLIWFRPEIRKTVNWGGNPTKPAEISEDTSRAILHPRRSFALWQEMVSGQSAPWQPLELEHASALREDMAQDLLKHRALEVSRLNAELIRSNKDLEHFAAMASHDLQEPLRTIGAYTELVFRQNRLEFDPDSKEMVGYIVSSTKRMGSLIRSLLDYARSGRREGESERIPLESALRTALDNLRSIVEERKAEVQWSDLPTVNAPLDQLARVFQNLISNALRYCPVDRTPVVRIGAENQGREWLISVQDNGPGFDPSQKEAIFQSFYRLHRDSESGTGLGLAICRNIIQSFGGRIWAETTPGHGATFHWTIPVA